MHTLRLGTRGSPLAMFQAQLVAAQLRARADVACEIVAVKTSGDRLSEATLSTIGGKRLFVKEIEDALLAGDIDLAVHSSKDMPAVPTDGLALGAVLPREDARDAVVMPDGATPADSLEALVAQLGAQPRLGTGSVRRTTQLARVFSRARFLPIRGNLDTRLRKLDARDRFDALVLAAAGLRRLQYTHRVTAVLPVDACVPAPGQGIIAVEVRRSDESTRKTVSCIDDALAAAALAAERTVVATLGGGCQMPIGAHAALVNGQLEMTAIVASISGARMVRARTRGDIADPQAIGARAARLLVAKGAHELLAEARRALDTTKGSPQ